MEKPQRKRPLGKPTHSCVNNLKMDLKERGSEDVDWINLAQDREKWRAVVNTVGKLEYLRNS